MVTSITGFGRTGLSDWVVQRVSAVILLAFIVYLSVVVFTTDNMDYAVWSSLFAQTWMKTFSLLALLSLCAHAWIGMWTISTDYFTTTMLGASATRIRFLFQLICMLVLFSYFVWCVQILWSN